MDTDRACHESYGIVAEWLFDQTLNEFYVEGDEVPEVSPTVMDAITHKQLASHSS